MLRNSKTQGQAFGGRAHLRLPLVLEGTWGAERTAWNEKGQGGPASHTYLSQQLRQAQHLPGEHTNADEDGGHLPQRAADLLGRDLVQVHGERAEGDACEGSMAAMRGRSSRGGSTLGSERAVVLKEDWSEPFPLLCPLKNGSVATTPSQPSAQTANAFTRPVSFHPWGMAGR